MNQNQFDALVSLCYNCGGGTTLISNSPLVRYLKGQLTESQARSQYANYIVTAGGQKLQGLVNRRNAEANLFFSTLPKLNSPMLAINRSTGTPDDTISITWDAVPYADSYWLHIYRNGEDYVNQTLNQKLSYSSSYPAGKYTAYVVSCNSQEEALSSVDFSIYNSVPEKPNPKISKESYSVNETVDITWDATKDTDSYWLHIYRNDEDYVNQSINQDLSYSKQYPAGEYTAYIVSCNGIGETLSNVSFKVYDSTPSQPNPKISKKTYSVNETVDITWDATKNTDSYWLHIYRNGEDYVNQSINQDLSYSKKYPVGEYTAYIVSCNGIGETLSSVSFTVINELNISFNANEGVCSTSGKSVFYGETYGTLPTPSRTGYTFDGWYTEKMGGTKIVSDTKVTTTANQTLYAHWTANKYTIKYDANTGNGTMDNTIMTYDNTETLRKNTFTKTGYSFESWSDGNGHYYADQASVKNLVTSGTIMLWVKWKPNTYKVTLDEQSGKTNSINVVYGETYGTLPTPVKEGYTFDGWYTEKTGGTKITADTKVTVTENQTLYAHWVDKEVPVINSIDVTNLTMDGFRLVIKAMDTARYQGYQG